MIETIERVAFPLLLLAVPFLTAWIWSHVEERE